jgi:hypothetical protein
MRQRERQRLEAHLQRLKDKRQQVDGDIAHTARKLRAAARHARQQRRLRFGELVELAGLDHLDPATVLGGLCEVAQLLHDPQVCARWQALGVSMLQTPRTRRRHSTHTPGADTHGSDDQAGDADEAEE